MSQTFATNITHHHARCCFTWLLQTQVFPKPSAIMPACHFLYRTQFRKCPLTIYSPEVSRWLKWIKWTIRNKENPRYERTVLKGTSTVLKGTTRSYDDYCPPPSPRFSQTPISSLAMLFQLKHNFRHTLTIILKV